MPDGNRSPEQLEALLRRLSAELDVPEPPDVAGAVSRRLAGVTPRRRRLPVLTPPRVAVALCVLLAAALLSGGLVPSVRHAVASRLGIGGVEVTYGRPAAGGAQVPPPAPFPALGTPTTVQEASRLLGFTVRIPSIPGRGEPSVYLAGDVVTLLYPGPPPVPGKVAPPSAARLLLSEFRGTAQPTFQKYLDEGTFAHAAVVDGAPALWIDGPHPLMAQRPDGAFVERPSRLSASSLVWQHGAVTLRLEGAITERDALAIASSVHP